jgi:hypothetical protein
MHFLEKVKIPEQADKYPGQLSGYIPRWGDWTCHPV